MVDWPRECPACEMFLPDQWAGLKHVREDHPALWEEFAARLNGKRSGSYRELWERERAKVKTR